MPTKTSYPGVYIEERSSKAAAISGVSTSVAAFVGAARMGPANLPVRIDSLADYVRTFGSPWDADHPMGHCVAHFFANGGSQAIVVRALAKTATAATAALIAGAKQVLVLTAASPGAWATRLGSLGLEVAVQASSTNPDDLFDMTLSLRAADSRSGAAVIVAQESYPDLSMAPRHPRYAPNVLSGSRLVSAGPGTGAGPPSPAVAGTSRGKVELADPTEITTANNVLRLSVDYGPPTDVVIPPVKDTPAKVAIAITNAFAAAGVGATAEIDTKVLLIKSKPGLASAVVVSPAPSADASKALGLGRTWGGTEISGAAALRPVVTAAAVGFAGGGDGSPDGTVSAADVVASGTGGGIYALSSLNFPRFNLLCLPDVPVSDADAVGTEANTQALSEALAYCADQRAFLLVDTARAGATRDWRQRPPVLGALPALGEHGALYFPRLRQLEIGLGGAVRTLDLPPCGAVAGVMARTDSARGVWKAPAGTDAGIVGLSGLTAVTDDNLSGLLNPRGVNVLRTFPAGGTVVWGARTLKGDENLGSEFKYVPVRRLTDHIASSLYLGTQFAVFEPNDADLWAQLRLACGAFMRGLFRQGAFQQSARRSEQDSFFVVCDETVNPQSEIDLGRVNIVVGFAPLKPAEFVIVTIAQISRLED